MWFLTILAFVLIFGLLVLIHELGHFWAARRSGVGVDEFGLGLPPRIWGITRDDTIYSINWIPFGGFVRLRGEDGQSKGKDSLANKSYGVRALVITAGVLMNFLLGYVLLNIGFWLGMPPLVIDPMKLNAATYIQKAVVVQQVENDSPAGKAGVMPGDQIVLVDGRELTSPKDLQEAIAGSTGEVNLRLTRNEKTLDLLVVPGNEPKRIGVLAVESLSKVHYTWWKVPYVAFLDLMAAIGGIAVGIAHFFVGLVTTGRLAEDVAGPVGIAQITAYAIKLGVLPVIQLVTLLSINLGIINILPFPALDGGRLLFLILEMVSPKKKINARIEAGIHSFGFVLLILLILAVTYRDIVRLF